MSAIMTKPRQLGLTINSVKYCCLKLAFKCKRHRNAKTIHFSMAANADTFSTYNRDATLSSNLGLLV